MYYVVFDKAQVEKTYVDKFNLTLLEIHASGEMNEIYKKHAGEIQATVPSKDEMVSFPPQSK